jgi:arylesterase/paraoxonase
VQGSNVGNGAIVAYDLQAAPSTYNIKPTAGLDEFRPHGLSLYRHDDGRLSLYVINHRASGQDTVEVFSIDGRHVPHYEKTITSPLFESANDLVAIGPDQFYLGNDSGASNGFERALEMTGLASFAKIIYYDRGQAKVVLDGFDSASGINASADGNVIYISATNNRSLEIYQRDLLSGELSHISSIGLGMAPDNIDVAEDGSVWVAGHPRVLALIKHFISKGEKSAPSRVYVLPMDNGLLADPVDIFTSSGDDLSASSVAAEHNGKIYIGGITPRKMLVCEPG